MKYALSAAVLSVLMATSCAPTWAATYPVDDSGSRVLAPALQLKWDRAVPADRPDHAISGTIEVEVRLNVAPWRGRSGRIHLVLPAGSAPGLSAQWISRGVLQPGSVRAGERAPVFTGMIMGDEIEDRLVLTVRGDARELGTTRPLEFSFEIDVESP